MRKFWLATVCAWAMILGVLVPGAHAENPAAPADPLEITDLNPEVFSGDQDITFTARLNDPSFLSAHREENWIVQTYLQPTPLGTVPQTEEFLEGKGFTGWRVDLTVIPAEEIRHDLTDSSVDITVTIPAAQLPAINSDTAGTRGLTLRLTAGNSSLETRSLLLYEPVETPPVTAINVLAFDLSATASDPETGRALAGQAERLMQIDGVSLAVTPEAIAVVDEPKAAGAQSQMSGEKADGTDWQAQHRDALLSSGTNLVVLAEENADISALASSDLLRLLRAATDSRHLLPGTVTQTNGTRILTDYVVASKDGFTRTALHQLPAENIVAPANWGLGGEQVSAITPTSRRLIDPDTGLLVTDVDGEQSVATANVLSGWEVGNMLLNRPVGSAKSELLLRQQLRTAALSVGQEDPEDKRYLSTTLNVSRETVSPALTERVQALLQTPGIEPVSISRLSASVASVVNVSQVPNARTGESTELGRYRNALDPLNAAWTTAEAMATSTPAGSELLAVPRNAVLAATAADLTASVRKNRVDTALAELEPINNAITVSPMGTVNIVNSTANFRVTVQNSLDEPVGVRINLNPSNPKLQAPESSSATVPAQGSTDILVPVRAVASGDVTVRIIASTASGTVIDSKQQVAVRLRANWEDRATMAVGAALILLFGFGIVRTVRRGRRPVVATGKPGSRNTDSATPAGGTG